MWRKCLAALAVLLPTNACARPAPAGAACYDTIAIGVISEVVDSVRLAELLPKRDDGTIYAGSRYDLKVEIKSVLDGERPPSDVEVFAVMTYEDVGPAPMLFYLHHARKKRYWAVEWRKLGESETPTLADLAGSGPPPCRG